MAIGKVMHVGCLLAFKLWGVANFGGASEVIVNPPVGITNFITGQIADSGSGCVSYGLSSNGSIITAYAESAGAFNGRYLIICS